MYARQKRYIGTIHTVSVLVRTGTHAYVCDLTNKAMKHALTSSVMPTEYDFAFPLEIGRIWTFLKSNDVLPIFM
jgi:hypothetical protein